MDQVVKTHRNPGRLPGRRLSLGTCSQTGRLLGIPVVDQAVK